MPFGPGTYDPEATELRQRLKARGVIVIVLDGARGSGFSGSIDHALMPGIPQVLRGVAGTVEIDLASIVHGPGTKE